VKSTIHITNTIAGVKYSKRPLDI